MSGWRISGRKFGRAAAILPQGKVSASQATLPAARVERTIAAMPDGEAGWTVPWAMWADEDMRLWVNGEYATHPSAGGTAQMFVRRTSGGVKVDITACDHKWTPGRPGFAGEVIPLVVVELTDRAAIAQAQGVGA